MKKIKVILYQKKLAKNIPDEDIQEMKEFSPHFICFPEYFFTSKKIETLKQTPENQEFQLKRIKDLSLEINAVIIGGTMAEIVDNKIHNTTFIYQNGKQLGFYRKKNLFFAENGKITPGNEFKVFEAHGIKFGVMICADVFHDETFEFMKHNNAKIIFSPTFSLKKEETIEEKFKRDNDVYVRGAKLSNAPIVKVCGVKSKEKDFLQARSLIAGTNKIIFRVKPDEEDKEMIIKQEIII